MKSRLFWKILLAYGVTFFLIVQVVGLILVARINLERDPELRFEPPQLVAAQAVIESGGLEAYDVFRAKLPDGTRDNLILFPGDQSDSTDDEMVTSRVATAPDGRVHTVVLKGSPFGVANRVAGPPWEVVLVGALGGLAFSAALAFYLTIPLNKLRAGFAKLASGELEARIGSAMGLRNDEIAALGRDFDGMARRLQSLVEARTRLLHDVSHEFRSPLARVHMAASLIEQTPDNTERCLKRINLEVDRLNALVEELLTLTRIEAGGFDLELEYFDLVELLESVVSDAEFETEDNPDRIAMKTFGLPCSGPALSVRGQPRLIKRAIENLLRNAIKFSPSDQPIEVDLVLSLNKTQYSIEVRDAGPGIPADMLDTIFDPFVRHGDNEKGYGLGLAIAKRAVEAHGGSITARLNEPTGLSVFISLPVAVRA